MQQAQAVTIIQQRWLDTWPGLSGAVETYFDNEPADEQPEYVLLNILRMPDIQDTMGASGNRRFRRNGIASVKINVAAGAGRARSDALVAAALSVLEARSLPGSTADDMVKTYAAMVRELGTDGQHYTVLVNVPFAYWEVK